MAILSPSSERCPLYPFGSGAGVPVSLVFSPGVGWLFCWLAALFFPSGFFGLEVSWWLAGIGADDWGSGSCLVQLGTWLLLFGVVIVSAGALSLPLCGELFCSLLDMYAPCFTFSFAVRLRTTCSEFIWGLLLCALFHLCIHI